MRFRDFGPVMEAYTIIVYIILRLKRLLPSKRGSWSEGRRRTTFCGYQQIAGTRKNRLCRLSRFHCSSTLRVDPNLKLSPGCGLAVLLYPQAVDPFSIVVYIFSYLSCLRTTALLKLRKSLSVVTTKPSTSSANVIIWKSCL